MTKEAKHETQDMPSKHDILETVTAILASETGFVERDGVAKDTNLIDGVRIHHDDLSLFLTRVFVYYDIPVATIGNFPPTLEGVADFVFDRLASGATTHTTEDARPGLLKTLLGRLRP